MRAYSEMGPSTERIAALSRRQRFFITFIVWIAGWFAVIEVAPLSRREPQ